MDIAVFVKRVPDTETKVRLAPDGKRLDLSAAQWIMAPYDEIAVEKALQLRDAGGGGSVTVVTAGPAEAGKELRTALAMGADKAIHVLAPAGSGDALATARALAEAVRGSKFDLLLCGKQATDDDDAAVGPMIAALLGAPLRRLRDVHRGRRRQGDGPARDRRRGRGARGRPPGRADGAKGPRRRPPAGVEGHHGREEEAARGEAAACRHRRRRRSGRSSLPAARAACRKIPATAEGMKALLHALRSERGVL